MASEKKEYEDIPEYARETVWFGRRKGATVYRGKELQLSAAEPADGGCD